MEICHYKAYRLKYTYFNPPQVPEACEKLLSDPTRFSELSLTYDGHRYAYTIPPGKCTVVQMFHTEENEGREDIVPCQCHCQKLEFDFGAGVYFRQCPKCKKCLQCLEQCQRPCKIQLARPHFQSEFRNMRLTGHVEANPSFLFAKYVSSCSGHAEAVNGISAMHDISERVYVDKPKPTSSCPRKFLQEHTEVVWPTCAPKDDLLCVSGRTDSHFSLIVPSRGLFEVQLYPGTHSWVDVVLHEPEKQELQRTDIVVKHDFIV